MQFRKANPSYIGLTDREIADQLNEGFREELQPQTENWNGYELTFYVNPTATDIKAIKPYAAYDLKYDEWTVTPNPHMTAPTKPEWENVAQSDHQLSHQAFTRFGTALNDLKYARDNASRRNAEVRLNAAVQQGNALYEEIHGNRGEAFSASGEGYGDFHNYRWQAAKGYGTIDKLRTMRDYAKSVKTNTQADLYGVELPNTDTLIRRAALYGNQ